VASTVEGFNKRRVDRVAGSVDDARVALERNAELVVHIWQ
jgi:hypothetical protein